MPLMKFNMVCFCPWWWEHSGPLASGAILSMMEIFLLPLKMKSATYLSIYIAINISLSLSHFPSYWDFADFFVLVFNDEFDAKLALNIMQIVPNSTKKVNFLHHCRKLVQIRWLKGAGTNMNKFFVVSFYAGKTIAMHPTIKSFQYPFPFLPQTF